MVPGRWSPCPTRFGTANHTPRRECTSFSFSFQEQIRILCGWFQGCLTDGCVCSQALQAADGPGLAGVFPRGLPPHKLHRRSSRLPFLPNGRAVRMNVDLLPKVIHRSLGKSVPTFTLRHGRGPRGQHEYLNKTINVVIARGTAVYARAIYTSPMPTV
jgi:hypothetical protein